MFSKLSDWCARKLFPMMMFSMFCMVHAILWTLINVGVFCWLAASEYASWRWTASVMIFLFIMVTTLIFADSMEISLGSYQFNRVFPEKVPSG